MTFFIPERRPSDGCHGSSRPSNPLWSCPSSLHRLSRLPSGVMAGWLQVVEEGGKSFSGGGEGGWCHLFCRITDQHPARFSNTKNQLGGINQTG